MCYSKRSQIYNPTNILGLKKMVDNALPRNYFIKDLEISLKNNFPALISSQTIKCQSIILN